MSEYFKIEPGQMWVKDGKSRIVVPAPGGFLAGFDMSGVTWWRWEHEPNSTRCSLLSRFVKWAHGAHLVLNAVDHPELVDQYQKELDRLAATQPTPADRSAV